MQGGSLHDLVKDYRQNGNGCEEIVARIGELLYRKPENFGFDDEDDAAEAYLRYRSRIARMADRFEDRGQPFEVYLASNLRFLARTVRRERRRVVEKEIACERSEFDRCGPAWCSEVPEAFTPASMKPGAMKEAYGSRIVFLALKCAWDLDDAAMEKVSRIAEVNPEWLASVVSQARISLEPCRARFERIAARRNLSWCRLRVLQARLSAESDRSRIETIARAVEREKRRLERIRACVSTFRPLVPNSVIARILGVPKGTVDSGLYYLKRGNPGLPGRVVERDLPRPSDRPARRRSVEQHGFALHNQRAAPRASSVKPRRARRRLPEAAYCG